MGSYISYFTAPEHDEIPRYVHASRPTRPVYEMDTGLSHFTPIRPYVLKNIRADNPERICREIAPIEEYRVIDSSRGSSSASKPLSPPISIPQVSPTSQPTRASLVRDRSVRIIHKSDDIKKSERQTHKCRGRAELVAWFEVMALIPWDKPPRAANELYELADGDLLLNWLDSNATRCQVWKFVWRFAQEDQQMVGDWRLLEWGAMCSTQDFHRLIITDKGSPSFVAESTWTKKYRNQPAKIVS
ncbi:hypothetical protein CPB83DRAFT_890613 [Crepidotus variabilis]|uniref:Uncharacterized protein n=1 Tax=Crepidotus variabilis TaxID=179855 RepID=A0A9P6JUG9_9AGAR|nr:hypothetical protein CPB83DRAFT_890613 [Crepidotus variabilis]